MRGMRAKVLVCALAAAAVGLFGVLRFAGGGSDEPWRLVAYDDFDGAALDTAKWTPMSGVPGCCPRAIWDPSMVKVEDGLLRLENRPVRGVWMSGGVGSWNWEPSVMTHGRVDARVRFDAGEGVSAAALLWPVDNKSWPPEIDFFEVSRGDGARKQLLVSNHFEPPGRPGEHGLRQAKHAGDFTGWHDVSVRWELDRLTVLLDGKTVFEETDRAKIPDIPMWVGLQTHVEPDRGRWPQLAPGQSSINLEVDWVRIYQH